MSSLDELTHLYHGGVRAGSETLDFQERELSILGCACQSEKPSPRLLTEHDDIRTEN